MTDFLTACWLGIVGACIGSFLNVVAYRLPRGMSVVWKPSHCPRCGHAIRARDNVPIVGWLLLRGRCRDCGQPIAARYAIVELITGAAFFALAYIDLFDGGAYLPGGPFTQATGALATVWRPVWPLLAWYAYHVTIVATLIVVVLVALDKEQFSRRAVAVIALLVALFAAPYIVASITF